MTISFNDIPQTLRVPLAYIEFDNSNAIQGLVKTPYKLMVLGQKLSSGEAEINKPVRVNSVGQAKLLFGEGSLLFSMFTAIKKANSILETWALPLEDNENGVKATATLTFSGAVTKNSTLYLYIGGLPITCKIIANEELSATATRLASSINTNKALPVTANAEGKVLTLTCKWPGLTGNDLSCILSLYKEEIPQGLITTITPFTNGTADPDMEEIIAALGDEQWHGIVNPYSSSSAITALDTELKRRWGPLVQKESLCFMAFRGSHGTTAQFGASCNSHLITCMATGANSPQPAYIWASVYGAVALASLEIDPARPLQTLTLTGIIPPPLNQRWTMEERNLLLHDGIATHMVQAGDIVAIEREVTMYQLNAFAMGDPSYLDITTPATLGYIRYATKARITQKFPRHKLANDGTRFSPGQKIVTPSVIKAELLSLYRDLEYDGLVENFDQYKADLLVERNLADRNRIDVLAPPDIVNQFRIFAMQAQFVL